MVDCLFHKHLFSHPLPLLRLLEKNIIIIYPTCSRWSADLFDMNLINEYKSGGCQWRKLFFVVTRWYMSYFCLLLFVFSKQYVEGEISWFVTFFFCLIIFLMYLLFILWKSVEHNQPLFCLVLSWLFPLTLILSTLLNFLYYCYLRLEYQKG